MPFAGFKKCFPTFFAAVNQARIDRIEKFIIESMKQFSLFQLPAYFSISIYFRNPKYLNVTGWNTKVCFWLSRDRPYICHS